MLDLSIDDKKLRAIADEFEASDEDLRKAYNRALGRTASRMRTMARKAIREGLELRSAAVLKARLRLTRQKPHGDLIGGARLWIGENDMPLRYFKGRMTKTASGVSVAGRSVTGAFIGTGANGATMPFVRKGKGRLPIEAVSVEVQDDVDDILERDVYPEIVEYFFNTFRAEVRARTIYNVGG